jgi:hypothetical protein
VVGIINSLKDGSGTVLDGDRSASFPPFSASVTEPNRWTRRDLGVPPVGAGSGRVKKDHQEKEQGTGYCNLDCTSDADWTMRRCPRTKIAEV